MRVRLASIALEIAGDRAVAWSVILKIARPVAEGSSAGNDHPSHSYYLKREAVINRSGFLDDLPVDQIRDFEAKLYEYVDTTKPGILNAIMEKKVLDDNLKAEMSKVIKECKETFVGEKQAVAK